MKYYTLLVLCFLLSIHQSKADLCFRTVEEDTSSFNSVFIGECISFSREALWNNKGVFNVFNFKITESFKGLNKDESYVSLVVYSGEWVWFAIDSVYLIFANKHPDGLFYTTSCTNTRLLSNSKKTLDVLNRKAIKHEFDPHFEEYIFDQYKKPKIKEKLDYELLLLKYNELYKQDTDNKVIERIYQVVIVVLISFLLFVFFKKK